MGYSLPARSPNKRQAVPDHDRPLEMIIQREEDKRSTTKTTEEEMWISKL